MNEKLQREQSIQPVHDQVLSLAATMGETVEQRVDWLLQQTPASFGDVLINLNAVARDVNPVEHTFDGEGVQAGTVGGSVPPDQADKLILLEELLAATQEKARGQLESGESADTVMHETAMVVPVVLNKLHLFADGNGRTTRIIRMVMRDGDVLTPEKTEQLVNKDGYAKYDTIPVGPLERALMPAIRVKNETTTIGLIQDAVDEDEAPFVEDQLDALRTKYPNIDASILNAQQDGFNFSESLRLLAKDVGLDGEVSMKYLFDSMAEDPAVQQKFAEYYREVRKQQVELLMEGLLGTQEVPLIESSRGRDIDSWINGPRRKQALPEIDPSSIHTGRELQMAYMETFSPQRIAA
jgi:hypothetical protein